jgi:hypothetical protein
MTTNTTTVYVLRSSADGTPISYYPYTLERGDITPPWGYQWYDRMEATSADGALVEFKELQAAHLAALD